MSSFESIATSFPVHNESRVEQLAVRFPGFEEGLEELTLRAEEVGFQKSCINVGLIAEDR